MKSLGNYHPPRQLFLGILLHVVSQKLTDVSEALTAFIIREISGSEY
jgi:hypothetical protein